tara:strand:+ start:325 stop:642 length:318 start_codon:yes stop_codon:yes gene_type:complete
LRAFGRGLRVRSEGTGGAAFEIGAIDPGAVRARALFFVSHSRNAAAWYISASACCDDESERSLRWAARILTAAAISSGLASRGIFSMSLGALVVTIFIENSLFLL